MESEELYSKELLRIDDSILENNSHEEYIIRKKDWKSCISDIKEYLNLVKGNKYA